MIIVFVHGWSVTDTSTYGRLPEALAAQAEDYNLEINIKHICLGRYISFHDEVSVSDVARAFESALHNEIADSSGRIKEFSCITHSTGGPVVREWLNRYYGAAKLSQAPLCHLVMLAPANHGSPLAAIGKKRVGRLKAWFSGVEPGQRILEWLSLGSQQQLDLAKSHLHYKPAEAHFFPYVLTGQSIDKQMYDFINSYLVEAGSDGVVRVPCANLNYSMVTLIETKNIETVTHGADKIEVHMLAVNGKIRRPPLAPLGVIARASHSGSKKGIMASVLSPKATNKPQVSEILKCLSVKTKDDYATRIKELEQISHETQKNKHRYSMLVFVIKDNQGDPVMDYEIFLLGGEKHNPDKLSKGFFIDKQQNVANPNHIVYYVDYDVITQNKLTGFRVIAHPQKRVFILSLR
jgi:hypothetical protein